MILVGLFTAHFSFLARLQTCTFFVKNDSTLHNEAVNSMAAAQLFPKCQQKGKILPNGSESILHMIDKAFVHFYLAGVATTIFSNKKGASEIP